MEFAKELIRYVISERIGCCQTVQQSQLLNNNKNKFVFGAITNNEVGVEAAINEIDTYLTNGLSIAIHILLGHTNCKSKQPSSCKAAYTIEIWTLQIASNVPEELNSKPQMIPMFLKQAIRSQLYFSPTKSWFSSTTNNETINERTCDGFQCIYKIVPLCTLDNDNSDKFCAKIDRHTFPSCKLDGRMVLNVHVKWLKKEYFPTQLPICPNKRIDNTLWSYPDSSLLQFTNDGEIPTKFPEQNSPIFVQNIKKLLVHPNNDNSKDQKDCSLLNTTKQLKRMSKSAGSDKPPKAMLMLNRNRIYPILHEPTAIVAINENLKILQATMPINKQQRTKTTAVVRFIPQLEKTFKTNLVKNDSNDRAWLEGHINERKNLTKPKRNDFILMGCGQPVLSIEQQQQSMSQLKDRIIKKQVPDKKFSKRISSPFKINNRKSTRLLCNFEESALRGCLRPIHTADGFKLQIAVTDDSFSTQHIVVPVTTFYFDEYTPSMYMGYCNLSNIVDQAKMGIQIQKQCTLQAVLFNPQGSVVKIFLVKIDVSDMPPLSQTFIRQRTTSTQKPMKSISANNVYSKIIPTSVAEKPIASSPQLFEMETGNNSAPCVKKIGVTSPTGSQKSHFAGVDELPIKESFALKFLINLRLASDYRSRVFLHSDIKMLLSNKSGDLEGLATSETQLTTQMPQKPKYSSI